MTPLHLTHRHICLAVLSAALGLSLQAQTHQVTIRPDKVIAHINPLFYGSGMEDVNHEVYGGIYAQQIFGESLEEAPVVNGISHFHSYGDPWRQADGNLYSYAGKAAKLIYDNAVAENCTAEVSFRYDGLTGEAGLMTHVTDITADFFTGYSFVASAWSRRLIIRRHSGTTVKEVCNIFLPFEPTAEWNTLAVQCKDKRFTVTFNGAGVYTFQDTLQLPEGKTGILCKKADVVFKHFRIDHADIPFVFKDNGVSGMWNAVGSGCTYLHDNQTAFNGHYSQHIRHSGNAEGGIGNMSLNKWGICIRKGETLSGSLFLKGNARQVNIGIQNAEGTKVYCQTSVTGIANEWQEYRFSLHPKQSDPAAQFVITVNGESEVWVDQVCMMPEKQFHGLPFRADIARELKNEGLTFLRYGGSMVNSPEYMTRHMLGDRQRRQPYRGSWYRYETNGFGIIEFVLLARSLGMEPSFAINMEDNPADVAHLIEYLNGDTNTTWGSQRLKDGYPEPFNVRYVELGNEEVIQLGDEAGYRHYVERFKLLTDAMLRVDSCLQFVSAAWWRENSPYMESTFKAIQDRVAFWDYHPWVDDPSFKKPRQVQGVLERMQRKFRQWVPDTKTRCAIFEENGSTHGISRMLGHIIAQNAARRNADFVLTTCQANALEPYHQNDNGWNQGQVFFTPSQVWHQPTSYAEQLSARHHQPLCVECTTSLPDLDIAATRDTQGKTIVLHIANTSDKQQDITTNLTYRSVKVWSISGQPDDDNTPENPRKITPQAQHQEKGKPISIYPYSYTVVELKL